MDQSQSITSALPGGISVTHLRVYDFPGPDSLSGGSPHLHFACTEAYFVLAGEGAVQTLSSQGYRETPLRSGSVVWFTPGVIHRLINRDGHLEIYVVMENAGLPEHGDSVLTFPNEYLRSEEKYLQFASLSPEGSVYADNREAATRRRDLAVNGFLALRKKVEAEGVAALRPFDETAVNLMRSKERSGERFGKADRRPRFDEPKIISIRWVLVRAIILQNQICSRFRSIPKRKHEN